jgi:hypothetical protein
MSKAKIYYAARIEGDGGATEIDGAHVVLEEDYDALSHRCDKLREMLWDYSLEVEALYVERDRLREALEKILKCTLPVPMQDIARAALAEGGQDEPT